MRGGFHFHQSPASAPRPSGNTRDSTIRESAHNLFDQAGKNVHAPNDHHVVAAPRMPPCNAISCRPHAQTAWGRSDQVPVDKRSRGEPIRSRVVRQFAGFTGSGGRRSPARSPRASRRTPSTCSTPGCSGTLVGDGADLGHAMVIEDACAPGQSRSMRARVAGCCHRLRRRQ